MSIINRLMQSMPSMGSMDKSLSQDQLGPNFMKVLEEVKTLRTGYQDGGPVDPVEREIAELEMFVGLRPLNSYEAALIEEMKDRLSYLYSIQKGQR